MRTSKVQSAIKVFAGSNIPVMLWGKPGIGKSEIVEQFAKSEGRKLFDVRLALLDPTDLRGIPYFDPERKKAVWGESSILPGEGDENAVLFLDEINSAPPSIQAAAYQLVLNRKVGEYELPEGVVIVAAGNRKSDKGVVYNMPAPLQNRFAHVDVEASTDDWLDWATAQSVNPLILGIINFKKDLLHNGKVSKEDGAFGTPRTWMYLNRLLDNGLLENNDAPFIKQIVAGTVGEGEAAEFVSYIKVASKLPNPNDILSGKLKSMPENIQKDVSVHFALVNSLIIAVREKYAEFGGKASGALENPKFVEVVDNFVTFLESMSDEMAMYAIRTSIQRDQILYILMPVWKRIQTRHKELLDML